ncbi:MAG: tRNA (guanosine(46)-N7)-methyltransferase TrmB [Epsilonproteobacteria bacterium]|nr:tRNA (guanosine(46)-N7)-methyltransferase TrmB [Campylobacterota bacterium]
MPHILIDRIKDISYPAKCDGVEFNFKAQELVCVNDSFFIKVQKRDNGYLVKYDKITRPLLNELKKAYKAFAKLNEAKIIFQNIDGIKEKLPNKNLLKITDNLNDIDIVEVGFGSGRHLLHLAKQNPDKTILGIEIHKPSIEQVLKRTELEGIKNIKILNHDARIILSKIDSNQLEAIYVHFPVPWDKKPHRRVINKEFISQSIRTLKKDGFLHLRTDSENYFEYSLHQFLDFKEIDLNVKKNMPYVISSKYEDRWKKQNKNIYDIYMINHQISPKLKEEFDFSFDKKLTSLDFSPKVYKDFVIHIEKVFNIDSQKELIRLTMGNFNRPEHLYIINDKVPYYFTPPVEIKENYLAHKELKRLFNG